MTDRRADERIMVSRMGNLPPADLEARGADEQAFGTPLPAAVAEVVQHQIASGLDSVSDGEYVKRGGVTYIGQQAIAADVQAGLTAFAGKDGPGCIAALGPGTLAAAAEGARIASRELWGRGA